MDHFAKDLICGSISGLATCVSGYSFDTVKVRMQINTNATMISTLTSIIKREGFKNLFSGIYYPLATLPILNAISFSAYQLYKRIRNKQQLSFIDGLQSGAFAGLANTVIVGPTQLIKCRMQLNQNAQFKSSAQCLNFIIKREGIKGLFRGFYATSFRQVVGYAAYFATYEQIKSFMTSKERPKLNILQSMFVGSLAGLSCWIISYPHDIIKTMLQVAEEGVYQKNKWLLDGGFYDCGRKIYKKDGIMGFWTGIQPCLLRAIVANAIGIAVYQQTKHLFDKSTQQ